VQYLESLKNCSAFVPEFYEFVNLTRVLDTEVDFEAVMIARGTRTRFREIPRRAFVAPRAATFGTVRIYEIARGADEIAIFRTMDEAKGWLDLTPPGLGRRVACTCQSLAHAIGLLRPEPSSLDRRISIGVGSVKNGQPMFSGA
jgi:hypothetical protein